MNNTTIRRSGWRARLRLGLGVVIVGLLLFTLGADPGLFNLDRSPVVGFVQIAVLLVGLAMICVGGFTSLNTLWEGLEKTIIADIGYRLVATGYVVAAASGMADVFGFGSQPFPAVPYFGQWQAFGVMAGQIIIIFGLVLMVPSPPKTKNKRPPEQTTTQP
ncbi:MAG: hypothetical protein QME21_19795 [Anaerolineales bacterium]|nr:hypothetical protein [Anaerolineales bacterium]